jgi:hypothetical protein
MTLIRPFTNVPVIGVEGLEESNPCQTKSLRIG